MGVSVEGEEMKITPDLIDDVFKDVELPDERSLGQAERNHERLQNRDDPFFGAKWRQEDAKERHGARQSAMMQERMNDIAQKEALISKLRNTWTDPLLKETKRLLLKDRFSDPEYVEHFRELRRKDMAVRGKDPAYKETVSKNSTLMWERRRAALRNDPRFMAAAVAVQPYIHQQHVYGGKRVVCDVIMNSMPGCDLTLFCFAVTQLTECSRTFALKYFKEKTNEQETKSS